jgi:FkbM family methyltransferase
MNGTTRCTVASRFYKIIEPLRQYFGYDLINRGKFGYDAFLDIQRMSKAWKFPIECFIDIGANDGGTAKLASSYFPLARIYAFEPDPENFARLVQRMVDHRRFRAYNLALGSQIGEAQLFRCEPSDLNSLVPNGSYAVRFGRQGQSVPVRCTTLDEFSVVQNLDMIDVLKVDTEGFDLEVLKGAGRLLRAGTIRFIYCEFNDILTREGVFGGALAPIAELVTPYGYRFVATYTDYIRHAAVVPVRDDPYPRRRTAWSATPT